MAVQLLIRGGTVVTAERQLEADVRLAGGRIVEVGRGLSPAGSGEQEIDASGLLVMPGGVDPHVHLTMPDSEPALYRWADDFESGSRAALAGGITSLGNMATPDDGETPLDTVQREAELVGRLAIADVFFHPIFHPPSPAAIGQIPRLAAEGHTSIKVFMCAPEFDRDYPAFAAAVRAAGQAGMMSLLHCEDFATVEAACDRLAAAGRGSLRYYAESRPVAAEVIATRRAVAMCQETGAPVYLVHLSCEAALQVCRSARSRGLPVYVEARPTFLHLTGERYLQPDGALYVVQPPLREPADAAALWEGLRQGAIDTLATDDASHTRQQKLDPALNVANLCPGISELQVMLPMFFCEGVLTGRLSLQQFVALTSTHAARLFGLYPRKGAIQPGSDADLVLWDPDEVRTIRAEEMESVSDFSVYQGRQVTGWPRMTIRRGEVVYQERRITAAPGSGVLLRRGLPGAKSLVPVTRRGAGA